MDQGTLLDQAALFDQGTWAGIGTLLALVAFIGICLWAYSGRNKAKFDEAAQLPFADELSTTGKQTNAVATGTLSNDRIDDNAKLEGTDKVQDL